MPLVTSNMAVNVTRTQPDTGFEVHLRPHYMHAAVDIIRHYGWREIWCIYNSDEGEYICRQVLTRFRVKSLQSWEHQQ